MKTILYIHQSAELYGSDKTLLQLVIGIQRNGFNVIVIVPNTGPLTQEFEINNIKFIISPVLKLSRNMFTVRKLVLFLASIYPSIKKVKIALNGQKIDFVHSNTLAVLLGAIYSKIYGYKHIWHIHEIIEHPKIVVSIYKFLLRYFSSAIVFNSNATAEHWKQKYPNVSTEIIHNGIARSHNVFDSDRIRLLKNELLAINPETVVITLVGRISKLKGQKLLLEAFNTLSIKQKNCFLLFVGDALPGQAIYKKDLKNSINKSVKKDFIRILPFQKNIEEIYAISSIVVVPSTEAESFGMVALEAMMAEKPVIASGQGGLLELVKDEVTGIIFEPLNQDALARALINLIDDKSKRDTLGKNGKQLALAEFSLEKYIHSFNQLYLTCN